jgi:AcrR family transcriptional regulator
MAGTYPVILHREGRVSAVSEAMPLRERKKALTREAILAAAERLFEERGFDDVTVAEIADAANVSVKTLFVYFRSKDDLVFTDDSLIDQCLTALAGRPAGTTPAQAIAATLIPALTEGGIEGFHRGYGASPALRSRLLRMWSDYEDRVTAELAAEAGTEATPGLRLEAIYLVGILRTLTSPEVSAMIAGLDPGQARAAVTAWLRSTAAE